MKLNFWKKDEDSPTEKFFSNYEEATDDNSTEISYEQKEQPVVPERIIEPADPEKAKAYFNVSKWAVYICAFLLPLFFLPFTTSYLEINKAVIVVMTGGIGLVAWLLGVVLSGYLAWRPNPLDKGVLVLALAFVVAAVLSLVRFNSIFGMPASLSNSLIYVLPLAVIYFLIVNNTDDKGLKIRSLLGLSFVIALVFGILQMIGIYTVRIPFALSHSFNTVGSINALGVLAAISLPFFNKLKIDSKTFSWLRYLFIDKIGILVSVAILTIINWWVLWTIAVLGIVAMVIFDGLAGQKLKINKLILPMTIVALGVFFMIINLNLSFIKGNIPTEITPSFELSADIIASTLKDRMIGGYGLENFSIAFDKYGASQLAGTNISDVRFVDSVSEVFTLVVQGGLIMVAALVTFLISIVLVLWKFCSTVSSEKEDADGMTKDTGVLSATVALVLAMFLYPFNAVLMGMLFIFLGLSVLVVFHNNKKEFNVEEKISLSLSSSLGFIGGLIAALVGSYFVSLIYIGDIKYAQAINIESNPEKTVGLVVEAINWNDNNDSYYRTLSQATFSLLNLELKKSASSERDAKVQNYASTAIGLARRATELNPNNVQNWINLGVAYQGIMPIVGGVDKLSEDAFLKAAELRPGDANIYYRIGILYLNEFDLFRQLVANGSMSADSATLLTQEAIVKSEENFKRAIEISPSFGLAIYYLGATYDRQGELAEAIRQLEKLTPFNNNQPGLAFELGLLYYRVGRKDDALAQLERAVLLSPDYANAMWYLALIYEEMGDLDAAIGHLENILEIEVNKDNEMIATKLNELRAGQVAIPPGSVIDQIPLR